MERLPGWPNAGNVTRFLNGLRFRTIYDREMQLASFVATRRELVRSGALPPLTGDEMNALAEAQKRFAREARR